MKFTDEWALIMFVSARSQDFRFGRRALYDLGDLTSLSSPEYNAMWPDYHAQEHPKDDFHVPGVILLGFSVISRGHFLSISPQQTPATSAARLRLFIAISVRMARLEKCIGVERCFIKACPHRGLNAGQNRAALKGAQASYSGQCSMRRMPGSIRIENP
jgi:hypothetical protein